MSVQQTNPVVDNDNEEPVDDVDSEEIAETEEMEESEEVEQPPTEPSEEDTIEALRLIEAMLFASAEPLSERLLANRIPEGFSIKALLKHLQADYAERGVNLVRVGNSWAFRTATDIGAKLNIESEVSRKMGRAAIETMAIIAYHQPVTRAEIEEIRGVSLSKGTLDMLFEKDWIKPRGRRETPGRPMTWGTTDIFLDHFGLSRVSDLPGLDELRAAGLLESGPALNVYRSRGDLNEEGAGNTQGDLLQDNTENPEGDPNALAAFSSQGEEDALPEVENELDSPEPLDPEDN